MTDAERIDRAGRARRAYEEFIEPMFDELRNEYAERIVAVATTELRRDRRADAITTLSVAHKVLNTLDAGMKALIADGDMAQRDKLRAEKIEKLTPPERRLLNIAPF